MRASSRIVLLLILPGMLAACTQEFATADALQAYVSDAANGMKQTVSLNGTEVTVTYRPTDLWVHQEAGGMEVTAEELTRLRNKYNRSYYFILSLSRNKKEALHQAGDMATYSELVQTMSFRMGEYVTLTTTAADTIPVGDFMLNRTFGMSTSTDILFVFDKTKAADDTWVQFNLNEFGLGVGNQRFRFDRATLEDKDLTLPFITTTPSTHK